MPILRLSLHKGGIVLGLSQKFKTQKSGVFHQKTSKYHLCAVVLALRRCFDFGDFYGRQLILITRLGKRKIIFFVERSQKTVCDNLNFAQSDFKRENSRYQAMKR